MKTFEDFLAEEMSKYRVEVWDEVSPIGRLSAAEYKEQSKEYIPGSKVLLCYYNDVLAFVQPYHPFKGGPIREEELSELIPQWIRVLAEPAARQQYDAYVQEEKEKEAKQLMDDIVIALTYLIGNIQMK